MQFFCHNDIDSVINKNQEFQWLGVTAIIAIISFIFNSITTLLRNKADLVAKSRINWIQDVRKLMSVFLRDVHYYPFIFQQCNEKSKDDPTYDEDVKIVNELAAKIEEYQYLLLLNLSDNDDNEELNRCINDCWKWIENMPTRWDIQTETGTKNKSFSYEQIPTTNLLKVSRDYLKKEWEKAKRSQ